MRLAANALETVREALDGKFSHIEVRYVMDDQVGRADLRRLAPVLVKLRTRISSALDQREVQKLQSIFQRDNQEGWKAWLLAYTQTFSEWGWFNLISRAIAQEALLWVPDYAPTVENIRHYEECVYYGRWPETYDWFLFLSSQQELPDERRQSMLAVAAEIQLYHFYQPSKARGLLEAVKDTASSYRIDQVWGEYYLQTKQPEKARPYFERLISQKPHVGALYTNLGDCYAEIGDLRLAEEQYEQAVDNAPGMSEGYQSLADLLGKVDWYSDWEDRLQTYLERLQMLNDNPAAPYSTIGGVYRTLGKYEKAVQYFNQSLQADPKAVNSYVSLGHLELEQVERVTDAKEKETLIDRARQTFERLLKVAPDSMSGYWGMMFADLQQNDVEGALHWAKKVRGCHTEWASFMDSTEGELLRRQAKLDESRSMLLRSFEQEPINPNALSTLLSLSDDYLSKDTKTALELLDFWRTHAGAAEEYNYQNRVGNVWYYQQDYAQAAEHYRRAVALDSERPVILSNLALALENLKAPGKRQQELEEAGEALRKAIKLRPDESEYTQRYEKIKRELDFITVYGEDALNYKPVITPVRMAGEVGAINHLLNENKDALSDATQARINGIRERVNERLGVEPPTVLISYLPGDNVTPGKYVFSLREKVVEEGVLDAEANVFEKLMENLERVLECNMHVFTGYQKAHSLLFLRKDGPSQSLRDSSRSIILFMQVLQALLRNRRPVKEIGQIAAHVHSMSKTSLTPEQIAATFMATALAESEQQHGE